MSLSTEQNTHIIQALLNKGVARKDLHIEFFDHLASDIEFLVSEGKQFESAVDEVLTPYSINDLNKLIQITLNQTKQHFEIVKMKWKFGALLGLSLCVWIFIEYITGAFLGIPELGAIYGLISEVLIALILIAVVRNFIQRTFLIKQNFRALFKLSLGVLLTAALIVFVFMYFYIGWINHDLYGLYDGEPAGQKQLFSKLVVPLMGIGVLAEGMIIAFFVSIFYRKAAI